MSDEPTPPRIAVRENEDESHVDVTVDGEPFTSYRFGGDPPVLQKPVLFPIHGPTGARVTRGYPLEPQEGDRTDHPHHIGHWLSYGVHPGINGVNFWNVSDEIPPPDARIKGRIRHDTIHAIDEADGSGSLEVACTWCRGDGVEILEEETRFRFQATSDRRVIDRSSTLTAVDDHVSFPDDKEGLFAIRVARALELPETEHTRAPPVIVGPAGTPVPPTQDIDVAPAGQFLNADGTEGIEVWGKRALWLRLSGELAGDPVSVTIMDHPENPGSPTYWHARGYGLFAANPLGQAVFTNGEEEMGFALTEGESATFRYRLAIDRGVPDRRSLDERQQRFGAETF